MAITTRNQAYQFLAAFIESKGTIELPSDFDIPDAAAELNWIFKTWDFNIIDEDEVWEVLHENMA